MTRTRNLACVRPVRGALLLATLSLLTLALLAACGNGASATATTTLPPTATSQPTSAATQPASSPSATATTSASAPTATATLPAATATSSGSASSPSASPDAAPLTLNVYFLRDGKVATGQRVVPHTLQVASASLTELLKGPSPAEQAAGYSSALGSDVTYKGTALENGVATVNLSASFGAGDAATLHARLAQIVYTVTQFPTVTAVRIALDGQQATSLGNGAVTLDHPLTRADFEDITPAILVESPVPGGPSVGATIRITGTANTFEATFTAQVTDANGQKLVEQPVMATSGSGTRGTFDTTLTLSSKPAPGTQGTLTVFEASAKDGSPQNVITIPLTFQ